ncbi:methionyl-tRNA formyltransferase [Croceitalea rosinachiae]|uniref:Methionyl-tRNA formyltransferase n=1 Tax=Croceitalea rosinachiae TaxID=3075596 RepID=A0ABU3AC83_9FLAO|nr:methionyl-tRNA formyltransferase [Croceitalea sp. F388]MDT0607795.1 methionyl-tRNA formyltransferase [Croceitalea sp. F388]
MLSENKKRDLRIVFMGTPDFAVAGLASLIENDYNVVGVITAPDRPAGRGRKVQESAVKKYALENDLMVMQPVNLKNEDFLKELMLLDANLQIVVAFRMLPKAVWQMPEYGTFNLHASLLPQYRGAAPINWAIINGETETGVTTFFIDEKIDTGEVILQERIAIGADESAGELHDKLMHLGAELILKTVIQIENDTVELCKQTDGEVLKSAYKIYRETCEIDWNQSIEGIYNHIRGLSPYPVAWTTLNNEVEEIIIKIYKTAIKFENHGYKVGKVIVNRRHIKIAVTNGYIDLLEIQLPGKRRMKTQEVLNGFSISEDAYVR